MLLAGCAAKPQPRLISHPINDAAAPALVFSPPMVGDAPPMMLAREPRERAAFGGYDELIATYFYIRHDDRQSDVWGDQLERRAISERIGVNYR